MNSMSKNLVEMFENIRNLCEELDEQDCSIFSEPATAEILDAWEIKMELRYQRNIENGCRYQSTVIFVVDCYNFLCPLQMDIMDVWFHQNML